MSEWQALVAGFAFYLILEGLMPFLNPRGFKRLLLQVTQVPDDLIRKFGIVMLFVGVILLFSVR